MGQLRWNREARFLARAKWLRPTAILIETELLHYGYLFILLGTIVEGDATLLTAAFLAHRGYFRLSLVLFVAWLTTLVASHAYYEIARRSGVKWLEQRSNPRLKRVVRWAGTHGGLLLIASRFMIGFAPWYRSCAVPPACPLRGSCSGTRWAAAFGSIGYLGGHVLSLLLDDLRRHEVAIASGAAILVGGLVLWRTYGRELFDAWSLRRSAAPRYCVSSLRKLENPPLAR